MREFISLTLSHSVMLSFQRGWSPFSDVAVCANLAFEPLSETVAPRYLNLCIVLSTCPMTLMLVLMPSRLLIINLVFSALLSMPTHASSCGEILFLSTRPLMFSRSQGWWLASPLYWLKVGDWCTPYTDWRLVIGLTPILTEGVDWYSRRILTESWWLVWPRILTVPIWSSGVSVTSCSRC